MQLDKPMVDSEGLHAVCKTDNPDRRADIVFVHGISGGSHSTWRFGRSGETTHFFWLEALAEDLPDCGIWSLGYAAGITHWFGAPGMAIQDRARNLVLKLLNRKIGLRPLIFITHSMGGLEVKEIIVRSQTRGSPEWKQLVASIRGVVFCGTPHRGAHLATAARVLANYLRAQAHLQQMEMGAPLLDTLHDEFITWQHSTGVKIESYVEKVGLFRTRRWWRPLPLGVVVPAESGNPSIVGCDCHPISADHVTLVKPDGRNHDVYAGVLRFVTNALIPKPKVVTITVKLPDDFKTFSEHKKQEFRLFLAREANVSPNEILIGDPRAGSTKVDLQISEDAAARILAKFATGQGALKDRGIIKLDAQMPQSPGAKSVSLRRLGTATWAFVGREQELSQLDQIVERDQTRIVTIVAAGGIGKTTLVARWMSLLAEREWPGFEAVFDWSFYSQGTREQTAPSSDLFLAEALTFFGDAATATSALGAFDKGRRLAQLISERRALLVLDGLEPLQYSPTSPTAGELKDPGIGALLKRLAAADNGLCVVTTRYGIPELRAYVQTTVAEIQLQHLSQESGVALLRSLGVKGDDQEFTKLVADLQGHALSLTLLGSYLNYAHSGDIRRSDLVKLGKADAEEQGGHAFRVMEAYAQSLRNEGENGRRALALLTLLGFFDRPTSADCLAALLRAPVISGVTEPLEGLSDSQRDTILGQLEAAKLISVHRDGIGTLLSLDAHPLLREYFAKHLRAECSEGWRLGHQRIYEQLVASTPDKAQPMLEDLQPLYQAVVHGWQAGLAQEVFDKVYFARIQRFDEAYSVRKLGAFASDLGAIASFFDMPWTRISQAIAEGDQAWLLNSAAFYLRALGRLTEALEPMRAGLGMGVKQGNWKACATRASNLSELELTLGEVAGAVGDAEQSVTYADRSDDAFQRMGKRTAHADALHQAGRRAEAETRFREAEQMQAGRQPGYPLPYGLAGFRYCDLLLAASERAAWQITLNSSFIPHPSSLPACRVVSQRATQTLKWAEQNNFSLLTTALDHLTLGRAALYEAILSARSSRGSEAPSSESKVDQSPLTSAATELDAAVAGLRRAGQQDELPRSLLSRAWCSFAEGSIHKLRGDAQEAARLISRAQEDLDETWEIAERGPMKLFLADIHLYRARLFGNRKAETGNRTEGMQYPWESPAADLAAAEKLINDCGYHRRDEELADAKAVLVVT